MKKFKISILILVIIVLGGLGYTAYLGVFSHVNVEEKIEGGYKLVGLDFTGSYSKAGAFIADVEKKLSDSGIKSTKGFGIYYDDPKVTPEEKCRSFVGNVLEEKDYNKMAELKLQGFKVDSIPESESVVTYFPIKSSLSYMIGPMKVYPAFTNYMNEKKYTTNLSAEIYDMSEEKIIFIMQYAK